MARVGRFHCSDHELLHIMLGNFDAVQDLFPTAFESLILHLDAGTAFNADVRQGGNILTPVHIPAAGQLGGYIIQGICPHAVTVIDHSGIYPLDHTAINNIGPE